MISTISPFPFIWRTANSLCIVHLKHPGELGVGVGVVDGRHDHVGGGPCQDQDGILDAVGQSQTEDVARLHSQADQARGQAGDLSYYRVLFTVRYRNTNPMILSYTLYTT